MKQYKNIFLFLFFLTSYLLGQQNTLHHSIDAILIPENSEISVLDEITIPADKAKSGEIIFFLHNDLKIESTQPGSFELVKEGLTAPDIGMDRDIEESGSGILLNKYRIRVDAGGTDNFKITIRYKGKINHPIVQSGPEYARGFSQTPGIISEKGVYLSGSSYWIPYFDESLFSFTLHTRLPDTWKTVSQGKRIKSGKKGTSHLDSYEFPHPTEEVFLIAAPFTEYGFSAGAVKAQAFLRTPDENLANKYLETTAQYLEMYRQLVGPFPFTKFALVENFWETGYGMPSFTLLGEKVIRFPFILHSSYPHELLHNWWGNGVYVDFSGGNWCEGLTAYMADHLIKEQRGQGYEYRRSTLQSYTDYVNADNDFPLNQFTSRHNASSSAIGYGKSLMLWHMLRQKYGDEIFKRGFQKFYRNYKFKRASYNDIKKIFAEITEQDLDSYFAQWVDRTGAPELAIKEIKTTESNNHYMTEITLVQQQDADIFLIDIPVVITTEPGKIRKVVFMDSRKQNFTFTTKSKPIKVEVDPEFDIFRNLDAFEIPPSLSKVFGADKILIVLPENAPDEELDRYETLAEKWSAGEKDKFIITKDDDLDTLPGDRAIWFLGHKNRYTDHFVKSLSKYNVTLNEYVIDFKTSKFDLANNSIIATARHPENPSLAMVWMSIDKNEAVPGLVRKLPHYGKYSYLIFEGDEPTNIAKGQWPAVNSPLTHTFDNSVVSRGKLPKRNALASLPPAFSEKRMLETVNFLASPELKGRGIDQPEIEDAAQYIADKFKEAGLMPGGDDQSYFQNFEMTAGQENKKITAKNIIGLIPGAKQEFAGQSVVVSAHYDHLGLGWPDVREGNAGIAHLGADDNASGVAVMLELAKVLAKSMKPDRTVIFVAFTAEEAGLKGSRYYVKNYQKYPANKAIGNLNLDTVGRLGNQKLLVLNGSSANEWRFIFMGTGYVTGVESEIVMQPLDASDQVAFIEAGVPGVQFFSGPHTDYHRPSDSADKIDGAGMVKVASVLKETITYLAERPEPLTFSGAQKKPGTGSSGHPGANKSGGRNASTGIMPNFSFSGEGVQVGSVSPDSPAGIAGIQKNDVITSFAGKRVKDLRAYSAELGKFNPGDEVEVEYVRDGKTHQAKFKLKAR